MANKRIIKKTEYPKRDIRNIQFNYFCGWGEYPKSNRCKAIYDAQHIEKQHSLKRNNLEIGNSCKKSIWLKGKLKILKTQIWNGKWWVDYGTAYSKNMIKLLRYFDKRRCFYG